MIRRMLILSGVLAAVFTVGLAGSAQAQTDNYTPSSDCALVSDVTPAPGQTVTVSGHVNQPGYVVYVRLTTTVDHGIIGTTISNADGTFSVDVTIPADADEGPAFLTIYANPPGSGSADPDTCTAVLPITITQGGEELPPTGSNSTMSLTKLGVSLIAAGGVLVLATRKRRVAATA